jgi:hypothetical protein
VSKIQILFPQVRAQLRGVPQINLVSPSETLDNRDPLLLFSETSSPPPLSQSLAQLPRTGTQNGPRPSGLTVKSLIALQRVAAQAILRNNQGSKGKLPRFHNVNSHLLKPSHHQPRRTMSGVSPTALAEAGECMSTLPAGGRKLPAKADEKKLFVTSQGKKIRYNASSLVQLVKQEGVAAQLRVLQNRNVNLRSSLITRTSDTISSSVERIQSPPKAAESYDVTASLIFA